MNKLLEIGNTDPRSFKLTIDNDIEKIYEFVTSDGSPYKVTFDYRNADPTRIRRDLEGYTFEGDWFILDKMVASDEDIPTWTISFFYKNYSTQLRNSENLQLALEVFSTVRAVILDFLDKVDWNNLAILEFSAKHKSRIRLYDRLAAQLSEHLSMPLTTYQTLAYDEDNMKHYYLLNSK